MNTQDLATLLDYHYWARDRVLDAVDALTPEQFTREMGGSFASVRHTLAHIYGAEAVWYARWHGEVPSALPDASQFATPAALRQAWTELEAKVRAYVGGLDEAGVSRVISYKFVGGQAASSPFWQMLQHLVNHASYHRGQVTTLLRQLQATPPKNMDMIGFYRERGY
ncbi:MAG TPA: DinB family protein [Terriglobia bacterium]|nr:DinB family protein [Terriglobia bacterium]